MTREQIKRLMDAKKSGRASEVEALAAAPPPVAAPKTTKAVPAKPALPKDISQLYAPVCSEPVDDAAALVYEPMLVGVASVQYIDARAKVDHEENLFVVTPIEEELAPCVDWERAEDLDLEASDLARRPDTSVTSEYGELAADATKLKNYTTWKRKFTNWIAAEHSLTLFKSTEFKTTSNPAESERDFRIRLEQLARDERDLRVGRAAIQAVLELSAQQVTGGALTQPGKKRGGCRGLAARLGRTRRLAREKEAFCTRWFEGFTRGSAQNLW